MTHPLDLEITKTVPAPRERVFRAWLDAATMAKFMRPVPEMPEPEVVADGREGGSFKIIMKAGDSSIEHNGVYKEVSEFDRIVFTWVSDYTQKDSTVTLTFAEQDDGATVLTLKHVGFPSEESRNNHQGGWGTIVEALTHTLT